MLLRSSLVLAFAAFAAACSSSSSSASPSTDGGTKGSDASTGDVGTTSSALLGVWDIALVSNGDQSTSVMTIAANSISFALDGSTMTANIGGDFVASSSDGVSARIKTTHTTTALDTGIFPYAIGGTWTFSGDDNDACNATVSDGAISMQCANLVDPLSGVFNPNGGSETTTFTRSSKLTSSFGTLGGQWHLATPKYTCDAKFEGASFDATCAPISSPQATVAVSITFGNTIASGKIDGGELSAKKR